MEFTPRIKEILHIVLGQETPVTEQFIADKIGVSKRTIQRELEYLEKGVLEYNLTLARKKGAGIWLEGSPEEKERVKGMIDADKTLNFSEKEKRRKYLLFELLRERVPRKLYYFSDLFGVSEATISGDMEEIEKWLLTNHIELQRKPGYGVLLKGTERNYRLALQRFIKENVENEESRKVLYHDSDAIQLEQAILSRPEGKHIYGLLNSEILGRVSSVLRLSKEPRLRQMTDNSYLAFFMHICIALDRILKGELIEENEDLVTSFDMDEDYILANRIVCRLEEEFQLKIPKVEGAYILLHIKGAKLEYSDTTEGRTEHAIEAGDILDIIDEMIEAFDSEVACVLKCDEELIHGLLVHIEPTIVRLKNEMVISNPLLMDIKQEYTVEFKKAKRAAQVLEDKVGLLVNEEEIGYLTMHFGAALERLKDHKRTQRAVEIGVICASGFGVARLMMTKLNNQLRQNVVLKAYGRDEITPFVLAKTDFFVSSMNMEGLGVDYIQVSPLITAVDLSKIEVKAAEYAHMPAKVKESDFSRQLDGINAMVVRIKGVIRSYKKIYIEETLSLEEFLGEASYAVTNHPAGAAVLKTELMAREEIMTQIFKEMGFALFHCRSRAVREPLFYTLHPTKGNYFTHNQMKEIKAAILLLIPENDSRNQNAQMLGCISSALVDGRDFLETIFRGEEAEIREGLQEILKGYFDEYLSKA